MKKFTCALAILLFSSLAFSQANLVVEAPMNDNTGGINRGPNGTADHAFLRGCYLVLASELTNIPSGTNLTSFGFTMIVGGTGAPVSGNFTVYLQNTSDISYQKGTNFLSALTGMSNCYASVMTVPVSAVTTSVSVTLSTPFNYTGGGLYVAYDWNSAGPFNVTAANYLGQSTALPLPAGGGANMSSTSSAPATMTLTASRPAFLFGFNNPFTNDVRVWGLEVPGKIPVVLNTSHVIKAWIKNTSSVTLNSIPVHLNVTGANSFANNQSITSLAPGAMQLVSFGAFTPLNLGVNTVSVSVDNDQYLANNSLTYTQVINCNTWGQNPSTGTYTNGAGFATGSGIIATPFVNSQASSLTGINLAISSDVGNVSQQLYGVLMNNAGVIIATTNTITITTGMLGTLQNFPFATPQSLTGGTTYNIGLAQWNPFAVVFRPFAYRSSYYTPPVYYFTGITAGALTLLVQNFGYFGMEAVLGSNNSNMVIASNPATVCAGSCASLTVPQGLTNYTWSIGSTGPSITACPLPGNSYTVIGTNTLGCPTSVTVSIGINPLPNVTIAASDNSVCAGNAITFTANGAVNYSLNNVSSPANISQTPLVNTIYSVTGIDANNCVNTTTINISVVTLSVTVTSNTAVCLGKQATLSASSTQNYNYYWLLPSGTTPFQSISPSPSVTTVYTVVATDGNLCTQVNTVMVTVNATPTVIASSSRSVICKGESVTLTASGASTYSWNNTSSSNSITVSPTTNTTYVVTGTNTAGCAKSATVTQNVALCTSLAEGALNNSMIRLYPNPNNGSLNISSESFEQSRTVEIYNALGSLVKRQELSGENTIVNLSNEANGIYLVQVIEHNKTIYVSKIVKQ